MHGIFSHCLLLLVQSLHLQDTELSAGLRLTTKEKDAFVVEQSLSHVAKLRS